MSGYIKKLHPGRLLGMLFKLFSFALAPLGWLAYLLAYLVPRDPRLVAFGVHTASYSGNVRALFESDTPNLTKVFISSNRQLAQSLKQKKLLAHWRYSPKGIFYRLKAGTYIYSSYPSDIGFWLSGGARLVNVWHGTPLKMIERDVTIGRYSQRNRFVLLYRLIAPYLFSTPHVLLTSSVYEEQCFKSAFNLSKDRFCRAFPPRLQNLVPRQNSSDVRSILYAPTWRDDHSFQIEAHLDLGRLANLLKELGAQLTIKLHPSDKNTLQLADVKGIEFTSKTNDVYELLAESDMLLTDYSSLMFEAMYLDIPTILFVPDQARYAENSRQFYFDPSDELKLPEAKSQEELHNVLVTAIEGRPGGQVLPCQFTPFPVRKDLASELVRLVHRN